MAKRYKEIQLDLPGLNRKTRKNAHGGDEAVGKRKERRPFDRKQALHVVLRSSKARGEFSMLHPRHRNHVLALVNRLKTRRGIAVYRYANVGNHVHLLIRARSRADWQAFIRELSGGIAMIVTGAKKGNALPRARTSELPESAQRGFWDGLAYSRIVSFGPDFKNVADYVLVNLWEAAGVPLRDYLEKGIRILEISEDGVVGVTPELSEVLARAG
ncbi:MAG: transposase [Oligoflexia bacterium]|nr:transposase [Oligoflexia bacterium]